MTLAPHPFSLRQLQYAVAVADERSFRRAAERCHVSQPALSAQIAEFEDALGVRLFDRGQRRVVLTPAGEALVARARRVLLEVQDLRDAAQRHRDPLAGTLRIGVIPTIAPYLLPHVDPALRGAFPKLALVWVEDKTAALVERVQAGELDAALLAAEAQLGELACEPIGHDRFVLAAPPAHPLARTHSPVPIDALHGEQVLLLDEGHCFRDQALELCNRAGADELGFRATSLPTLVQMAAGGSGVTLLPELALELENRHAQLAVRTFCEPAPQRTIALAYRKASGLGEALHAIAAQIRQTFAALRAGPAAAA